MGGSRSQSPAVSVCAKHCERCKDLQGPLLEAADAKNRDQASYGSYGSYGIVISDDFSFDPYDPA